MQGAADLQEAIRARATRYSNYGLTNQPFVLVNADPDGDIISSYVAVNDILWRTGSVLSAVDTCFKTFFALHTPYTPEARHLWMFIQKHLYDITLPGDVFISPVNVLIDSLT